MSFLFETEAGILGWIIRCIILYTAITSINFNLIQSRLFEKFSFLWGKYFPVIENLYYIWKKIFWYLPVIYGKQKFSNGLKFNMIFLLNLNRVINIHVENINSVWLCRICKLTESHTLIIPSTLETVHITSPLIIRFTYTTKPSPTFFYYLSGSDRPEETAVFIIVPKNNFRWIN